MQLTEAIIGCAIEVHKTLGAVNSRLRLDLIIGGLVVAEIKAIECVHPIHLSQVVTYLKLADYPAGLLLNFNVTSMRYGVRRLDHPDLYTPKRKGTEQMLSVDTEKQTGE